MPRKGERFGQRKCHMARKHRGAPVKEKGYVHCCACSAMHLSDALRFPFLLSCCAAGALQAKALDTYLRKKYQKQGIYHTPELQSKKFKTVGHTGALFATAQNARRLGGRRRGAMPPAA